MPHPKYFPNISPLDYDLFKKLKDMLWGVRFSDLTTLNAVSRHIPELNSGNLLNGIQRLPKRLYCVIES